MWAIRRRIEIAGIIIAAILVLIVLPYWVINHQAPTCMDGKQNQKELGVDCGGPCALLCKGAAMDLKILWTKVFPIREGNYDVVAYVENPNFDIGAPEFSYTAKLYDASDAVIATKSGVGYALPHESFVVFAGSMNTGSQIAARGSIEIESGFRWITTTKIPKLFTVTDMDLEAPDRSPRLLATLNNDTTDVYRNVDVAAVIYNSKNDLNNPIGVSSTKVEKLDAGGKANLIFTWPHPFVYDAIADECEAPTDVILVLDRSGSMRDERKLEQAKAAAEQFVDRLTAKDQVGYATFASEATDPMDHQLTSQFPRVKKAIAATSIHDQGLQFTNIGDGLLRAINELASRRRNTVAHPTIVLLTDGIPNRPLDQNGKGSEAYGSAYAESIARQAKDNLIAVYTIGLGSDVNAKLLENIASTPDYYYPAASGAELSGIYKEIATAMCKRAPPFIIIPRVNTLLQDGSR